MNCVPCLLLFVEVLFPLPVFCLKFNAVSQLDSSKPFTSMTLVKLKIKKIELALPI